MLQINVKFKLFISFGVTFTCCRKVEMPTSSVCEIKDSKRKEIFAQNYYHISRVRRRKFYSFLVLNVCRKFATELQEQTGL